MGVSIVSQLRSVSHIHFLLSKYQIMKLKCCCFPNFRASINLHSKHIVRHKFKYQTPLGSMEFRIVNIDEKINC